MSEATDIVARAKAMGVTTTLSGPMKIDIAQVMATEALTKALRDGQEGNRQVIDKMLSMLGPSA